MDSGQPIKWNHRWKITRINVKFCVWALKKEKNPITQGQHTWKKPRSFNWLLSKIHVQQINLFNFLGIYFTTSLCWKVNWEEHCLRLDFYGLFVYTHTHTRTLLCTVSNLYICFEKVSWPSYHRRALSGNVSRRVVCGPPELASPENLLNTQIPRSCPWLPKPRSLRMDPTICGAFTNHPRWCFRTQKLENACSMSERATFLGKSWLYP